MMLPSAHVISFAAALVASLCAFACATEPAPMAERNRPQFHYTPEKNWLNDPNGLVFFDGEWHLFHQYNPEGIESANKSWAHAVSGDLLHWEQLPLAIRYSDGIEIWSGSAVVDAANRSGFGTKQNPPLVAIYTGAGHGRQTQNLAYSTDRGRTWTKYAGNPVIDENLKEFRDPKVCWHEPSHRWIMVAALSDQRKVRFYASADLKKWSQLSEFGPEGSTEGIWECPDLFPLMLGGQTYWVLIVNVGWGGPASGGSATQYFVGDFDGTTFRNANPKDLKLWTDYGPDTYAAQTWSNVPASDGRRIGIAWMTSLRYCTLEPTFPWRGGLTVPRELTLIDTAAGVRLAQRPVRELEQLRAGKLEPPQFADAGQQLELQVSFPANANVSLKVHEDATAGIGTIIGYDAREQRMYLDRTKSRPGEPFQKEFPGRFSAPLLPDPDGSMRLQILVDTSSVEVFGNGGASVITANTFAPASARGFSAKAMDVDRGDVPVSVRACRLTSIREKRLPESRP